MEAHKSFRTSESLRHCSTSPAFVSPQLVGIPPGMGWGIRFLFGFRSSWLYHARGITELYFVVRFESRFRGVHHVLRFKSGFMTHSS